MKVLIGHHFYSSSSPSGENDAVRRDVDILVGAGHDVREYFTSSDNRSIGSIVKSGFGIRSREPRHALDELLRAGWRPDILHVHNLFPSVTSSLVRGAMDRGVPTVHTIHNYRRTCAAGLHFRDGEVCYSCDAWKTNLPAIRHGCYRQSPAQTVPVVINLILDRPVWNAVDAHIVLTRYMRDRIVQNGTPAEAVIVRPTSVADPGPVTAPGDGLLFVGRLSEEKGVMTLIDAWKRTRASETRQLEIIGSGELADDVRSAVGGLSSVDYRGRCDKNEVAKAMRDAGALVVPSKCLEGLPTVISEGFAHGRGAVVSDNPNLRGVISDAGWLARPNPEDLARTIDLVMLDRHQLVSKGENARRRYEAEMTPAASYELLMSAYELARARAERRRVSA